MTTKYDQAFDCLFDGLREIETKGFLSHDQVKKLEQAISDELDNLETEEEKLFDVVPDLSREVL